MRIDCQVLEKISKSGNKYTCLYLPDLEKTIFLEPAETKLLQLLRANSK